LASLQDPHTGIATAGLIVDELRLGDPVCGLGGQIHSPMRCAQQRWAGIHDGRILSQVQLALKHSLGESSHHSGGHARTGWSQLAVLHERGINSIAAPKRHCLTWLSNRSRIDLLPQNDLFIRKGVLTTYMVMTTANARTGCAAAVWVSIAFTLLA